MYPGEKKVKQSKKKKKNQKTKNAMLSMAKTFRELLKLFIDDICPQRDHSTLFQHMLL